MKWTIYTHTRSICRRQSGGSGACLFGGSTTGFTSEARSSRAASPLRRTSPPSPFFSRCFMFSSNRRGRGTLLRGQQVGLANEFFEDDFAAGRPAWERAGAQLVGDVAPFEAMKLRLLNASHSAFAYLGYLAGHEFIYQVAAERDFVAYMRALMHEVVPTLAIPPGVDVSAYQEALIDRFRNPALPHRTQQIAMDGSQKLPQRLLGTVRDNLTTGHSIDKIALAVAGWMRYVAGVDEAGREIKVSDPLASEFARVAASHRGDPEGLARGLLGLRAVFGEDLPADPQFAGKVIARLTGLYVDGAARTVARAASGV